MNTQAGECHVCAARAVSIQGQVTVQPFGHEKWKVASQNDCLCPGDRIKTGINSRAGLALEDGTLLRLKERGSILLNKSHKKNNIWFNLIDGVVHIISRIKGKFQVNTPYVHAAIEGTEFTVEMDQERAKVIVLEGRVRAYNRLGEVKLNAGEQAISLRGGAPIIKAVVHPIDAVEWALYYPPVIDLSKGQTIRRNLDEASKKVFDRVMASYRGGDLEGALKALSKTQNYDLVTLRASLYLQIGRVEAARDDLERVLQVMPASGRALALMSVIATVKNERMTALDYAQQAVELAPGTADTHIALSYAHQAQFELPEALESVRQAVAVETNNALAWSRLAQLQLMLHNTDEAAKAARRAVRLDPHQAMTQTALGFVRLFQLDLRAAEKAFMASVRLDQASPMPYLGLGLVQIRKGHLAKGRAYIETAANMDPGNALIRSYLGKAYYEEKRNKVAASQFELAKEFDGLDPTAWFYDAIRKQTENRPVEALEDLQTAMVLNDNRAVYRSRLLLDSDQASRSSSLARVYDVLGFKRLAQEESRHFLTLDPGNPSAHRFLADSYVGVQHHETARVSEVLQSQLLTPEIASPVSPSAGEADLYTVDGSGPSLAGYNEYNPLFNRKRIDFLANGISGSNYTLGEELAIGGFDNRGMLSAGYFKYRSDGYRENNDTDRSIKNIFAQFRVNQALSIQGEVKQREDEFGDMLESLNGTFSKDYREEMESDSYRIGLNYTPELSHTVVASIISQERTDNVSFPDFSLVDETDGIQYEAQYIYRDAGRYSIVSGIGYLDRDNTLEEETIFLGFPNTARTESKAKQSTAYAYLHLPWEYGLGVVGMDYVRIDEDMNEDVGGSSSKKQSQYNPKLGLQWDLFNKATLRLSAVKHLRGSYMNGQTLMPTQVAGFNQLFDDAMRTRSWRYGIAIDSQISKKLYSGIELTRRTMSLELDGYDALEKDVESFLHEAYIEMPIGRRTALSGRYRYDRFNQDFRGRVEPEDHLTTQTVLFELNYHHPKGLFTTLETAYVTQEVLMHGPDTLDERERFFVVNGEVGLQIPKRMGVLKLIINNMFDKKFNYHSTYSGVGSELPPPYSLERTVFLNLQFWL
jgi:tetratricopeptide (TPR) repeat protein